MYLKPKRQLTIVWAPSPALQSVGVVVCFLPEQVVGSWQYRKDKRKVVSMIQQNHHMC